MIELVTKRIPVTLETWESLHGLKKAGQTYDDLLQDMIELKQRDNLHKDFVKWEKEEDFVSFEEAKKELKL